MRSRDPDRTSSYLCKTNHLEFFGETITRPRGIIDTPRVTDEERILFLENT